MPPHPENETEQEYQSASEKLDRLARSLASSSQIREIDPHTTLPNYLQQIADVVAGMFPFSHRGIGVDTVLYQIQTLPKTSLETGPAYVTRNCDCKLPTSFIASLLTELAHQNHWPLMIEYAGSSAWAHIYLVVSVTDQSQPLPWQDVEPNTSYTVDFEPAGLTSLGSVSPRDDVEFRKHIGSGPNSWLVETDSRKGLQLFDQIYSQEVQNKYLSSSNPLVRAYYRKLSTGDVVYLRTVEQAVKEATNPSQPLDILSTLSDAYNRITKINNGSINTEDFEVIIREAVRSLLEKDFNQQNIRDEIFRLLQAESITDSFMAMILSAMHSGSSRTRF